MFAREYANLNDWSSTLYAKYEPSVKGESGRVVVEVETTPSIKVDVVVVPGT